VTSLGPSRRRIAANRPRRLFLGALEQLNHGFFAGARARDQQKWAPVLRPIARQLITWRMIFSANRFPLRRIMRKGRGLSAAAFTFA